VTACPGVAEARDPRRPHLMRADWGRDGDGRTAHLAFWRTVDGGIVLQDIQSNAVMRGRDMVRWLSGHDMPVTVVEVIPQAVGFWERMLRDGLIARWEAATGWPNPLERMAAAWPEVVQAAPAGRMTRRNFRRRITQGGIERDQRGKGVSYTERKMREAIEGAPPAGYGAILRADTTEKPEWLDPQEIVARHLPMGLSERKANFVITWDHPFRLRADHPRYSER
jgi:hypothetical protein